MIDSCWELAIFCINMWWVRFMGSGRHPLCVYLYACAFV